LAKKLQEVFQNEPSFERSSIHMGNFIEANRQWLNTPGYVREQVIVRRFGDSPSPELQREDSLKQTQSILQDFT
jgi:hypothetical protein